MKLREFFSRSNLLEGGNVSSKSPGWQGELDQEAEEIDLKIHNRDYMVGQLQKLLTAQNESFKSVYGRYIWEPALLKSGQMFSGSSLQFFDIKSINTDDFLNKLKKTTVGDIDTQIDQDIGDEVTAWLKSIIGKKVGNGTFLGFNSSLSSIWLLDDPQVRIQVDYELGPYDPKTKSPTEWFAYSHSSHYDDMAAGIKGVFHKYINRALTHAQASTKYVARVLKKSVKISDDPITDSDYSFAVSSAQGGGMSKKYRPYIDPATGEPMIKNGIPVMQQLDPKDRDYIQNLDQQFRINFGRKRSEADKNLQGSFIGTVKLMNKTFTPEQNEAVVQAFLEILFGRGAQMITKDDPNRDRDIKFAAVDAMLLGNNKNQPLNVSNSQQLRQQAIGMADEYASSYRAKKSPTTLESDITEETSDSLPDYTRQSIKHLYNRLANGKTSSAEMSNVEFQQIAQEILDNNGTLDSATINLKVDGAGVRFGKDASGRPFMMTSRVNIPLYADDAGYFSNYSQEKGQSELQVNRAKKYDEVLEIITKSNFIEALPKDTIVHAEMMYSPMAEKTRQGLKFVNIAYDPKKLGKLLTLIPISVRQYSTGDVVPNERRIINKLASISTPRIKLISNRLEQKGIDVGDILAPIQTIDPKNKENRAAFDQAKQALSDTIINSPRLKNKDILGNTIEGIVVNLPSGRLFKITSPEMKEIMSGKTSAPVSKNISKKTAVVAIGSFVGHRGHQQLWQNTLRRAQELGGDPYLFIGNAVGVDDPIPPADKLKTWHKLYPAYKNNIGTVDHEGGTLLMKIKHELINPLPGKPPRYDNIVIMVGEDRAGLNMANALTKAVNKFPGYEHVTASVETTPRETGITFTQLRNVLKDITLSDQEKYDIWSNSFDEAALGKEHILKLMDIARTGMGIKQQQKTASEGRLFNSLVRNYRDFCKVCGQTPCNCTSVNEQKELSEVSLEKLGKYKKAAGADARAADKKGDTKRADKRFSGIIRATKKEFEKDAAIAPKEQGVAEGLDQDYQVGEKVLTQVGGRWIPAIITKPINAAGNYGVKFKVGAKVINYVSSPDQLKKQGVAGANAGSVADELNKGIGEGKKKGVDGKACWKGYRYAGKTKKADGTYKDKCVPVGEDAEKIIKSLVETIIRNNIK